MTADCCICGQIEGDPTRDLLHRARGERTYERWIPYETDRFAVIPSIGALVPGHVLLCPRRHLRSSALLDELETAELLLAEAWLEGILLKEFGGPVQLFEHGNSATGTHVGCSVEHAHLHFVPSAPDLWPTIRRELPWTRLDQPLTRYVGGREYIRYRRGDGAWFVYALDRDGELPSQLLRRCFARALGIEAEWNWREANRLDVTSTTIERLRIGSSGRSLTPQSLIELERSVLDLVHGPDRGHSLNP